MTVAQEVAVIVLVNNREVKFDVRKATGLQIKGTAMSQGVPIQKDFALFIKDGNSPLKPVADDQVVELHNKQEFRATTTDDNSAE